MAAAFPRIARTLLLVLSLAPSVVAAQESAAHWPSPAEQAASLRRIRERLGKAREVVVVQKSCSIQPTPFPTRLPSRIQTEGPRHSVTLGAESVPLLASALGLDSLTLEPLVPGCPTDPRRRDLLELHFGPKGREVVAELDLWPGSLDVFTDDDGIRWSGAAPKADSVRALVMRAMPNNSELASAPVCTAPLRRDSAGTSPRFGAYIFVDRLPESTVKVPPVYPEAARLHGSSGVVMVQALIGTDGRVHETAVASSIPGLDAAAVEAVEQWKFVPAQADGKPVGVWVAIPIKFTLH